MSITPVPTITKETGVHVSTGAANDGPLVQSRAAEGEGPESFMTLQHVAACIYENLKRQGRILWTEVHWGNFREGVTKELTEAVQEDKLAMTNNRIHALACDKSIGLCHTSNYQTMQRFLPCLRMRNSHTPR